MRPAISFLILLTRLNDKAHSVKLFNCNNLSLEIVVEKIVVRTEPENFLLFYVAKDKLLHLLFGELTILEEHPYLLEVSLRVLHQLILMLNDVKTCLEHTLVFLRVSNSDLTCLGLEKISVLHFIRVN